MTDKTLTTTDTEAPIAGELVAQFCTLDDIKLLRNKYQGLVIEDDESYAQVKAALSDVKAARVGIEKDRKALKQKALDCARQGIDRGDQAPRGCAGPGENQRR